MGCPKGTKRTSDTIAKMREAKRWEIFTDTRRANISRAKLPAELPYDKREVYLLYRKKGFSKSEAIAAAVWQ